MIVITKVLIPVLLIIVSFFSGCSIFTSSRNLDQMESLLIKNETSFKNFAVNFLSQDELTNIRIDYSDLTKCKAINLWGICPSSSTQWGKLTGEVKKGIYLKEYLDTYKEVLVNERVSEELYSKVIQFIEKYQIQTVSQDMNKEYVTFQEGLNGLRYYINEKNVFLEDEEYIFVKKINPHWYVFRRDWN